MLTNAQKVVLKNAVTAAALNLEDYGAIAEWLNASTSFVCWKSTMTPTESRKAITSGDQLAQLDNLTVGKRDALLYAVGETVDTNSSAVRGAIENLCGTQNVLKAALIAAMKRTVNKAEQLLATGTGTDVAPATLGWEGQIDIYQIGDILSAV